MLDRPIDKQIKKEKKRKFANNIHVLQWFVHIINEGKFGTSYHVFVLI